MRCSPRSRTATTSASATCCPATSAAAPATSPIVEAVLDARAPTAGAGSNEPPDTHAEHLHRQPIERVEDSRFLRGGGSMSTTSRMPGLLHAAILRSSVAHGRIARIDASAALAMPGVHAVITAADMAGGPTIFRAAAAAAGDRALRAAGHRARQGALCRRADCDGARRLRRASPKTRWSTSTSTSRHCRAVADWQTRPPTRAAVREAGDQPLAGVHAARATPTRRSPTRPTCAASGFAPAATTACRWRRAASGRVGRRHGQAHRLGRGEGAVLQPAHPVGEDRPAASRSR